MDFGRILEAQERRRQELREATRRAALLRQLDLVNSAEKREGVPKGGCRRAHRLHGGQRPLQWLRAVVLYARTWRRA